MPPLPEPFEVKATIHKGPSKNDPLGQGIDIGWSFRGCDSVVIDDPGKHTIEDAFRHHTEYGTAQQQAIAKAAYEFGDKVFAKVFESVHRAMFGTDVAYKAEHPSVKLRREIDGLNAQVADLEQQLRDTTIQRDELRRVLAPDEVRVSGTNGIDSDRVGVGGSA